ncbi:MAG: dUTP diphosphatase [Candidatus Pacearchaeota archaeon]
MVKVKIKKLRADATLPNYAHHGDAGMDLYSTIDICLEQNQRTLIPLGFSMELPEGYVSIIKGKSGLALNKGLVILGGVIDQNYRGEYNAIILNSGYDDLVIKKNQKVAQLLIQSVEKAELEEVDELSNTIRGKDGFGSTGA